MVDLLNSITLPVMPRFLFKIQTAHRCPPPISFPSLPNSRICQVATIRAYLHRSATWDHNDFVFINPESHTSMVAGRLNYWLVKAIATPDVQGSVVRAHDVRKFAFSINWVRRADLTYILHHGFWASAHPLLSTYLQHVSPTLPPCVASCSLPRL